MSRSNKRPIAVTAALVLALLLAGCGHHEDHGQPGGGPTGDPSSAFPTFPTPSDTPTTTDTPTYTIPYATPPSIQPSQPTNQLNEGQGAVFEGSATGGQDLTATTTYLNAAVKDVDNVWSNWFKLNGMAEPMVYYRIIEPGQAPASQCKLGDSYTWTSTTPNAMYCEADDVTGTDGTVYDGTIWLPVQTFASMWSGNIFGRAAPAGAGDFAAAVLTAHEYGHKVQEQLSRIYQVPAPRNPQIELIADCFAGVWAYTAFSENKLGVNDIDIALHALGAIGDTVGSHGTNAERDNAFRIGLNGTTTKPVHALPSNCTKNYWPALPMN